MRGARVAACIARHRGFTRDHVDLEFTAAQLIPKMLAQCLLADAKLLGDFGLGETKSRSALNERALE